MSPPDHSESSPPGESVQSADFHQPTANGSAPDTRKRAAQFTSTHWSVIVEAQGESPAAQEALEKLCRIYWRPIHSFVQRQGFGQTEAEDLTQAFFADLLEHRSLTAVRKEKGRFRSFLLGALKHFVADERRRAMAIKRGKGQRLIPLEELSANTADGSNALFNSNGNGNTAIGDHACFSLGSGDNNVALGSSAGANVTTGSFNVYIGAGITGSEGEVGHTYISNINSTVQPPNGSVEYVTIDLNNRLLGHTSSSQRYKECIKPMNSTSETLYKLKPVTYRYKNEIDSKQSMAFGLIAEEVAKVNPVLIARNAKGQPESVHYEMVNAMLLNEFLKEHKTVQELKYDTAKQEEQIRSLTSALQKINARIETRRSVTKITSNNP